MGISLLDFEPTKRRTPRIWQGISPSSARRESIGPLCSAKIFSSGLKGVNLLLMFRRASVDDRGFSYIMGAARSCLRILGDLIRLLRLGLRSRRSLAAENLFLRKQLAFYRERKIKPRRADNPTRLILVLLSRWFSWRDALTIVRPETFVGWHRKGFRLFWRWKSKAGRRPIPAELQQLIRKLARENVTWGEERIANELLLKLGLQLSPRTIRKYLPVLPVLPADKPRGDQRWATFLRNHAQGIVACDFCVAVTATFRILYVFVLIEHASRRNPRQHHSPSHGRVDPAATARRDSVRPWLSLHHP